MIKTYQIGWLFIAVCCASCSASDTQLLDPTPPAPPASLPYRVQIGDELAVKLYLSPELNEDVTVRPDGRITTQLAQAILAEGHTPEEISTLLRAAYTTELTNPRISVEVKSAAPYRVYVAGEVAAPGELTGSGTPLTLLQAVSRAGGLRITGDPERVLIVRRGVGGQATVYKAQFSDALSGRVPGADVTLQPFDIIIVPKTSAARIYAWVNQHIQQFVPVSWGVSYNITPLTK